jgi:hypothetical protein
MRRESRGRGEAMLRMDHDESLAAEHGVSVERVREWRVSAYAKIRAKLRERGCTDVPDTDEGLYVFMKRLLPDTEILPPKKLLER